MGRLRVLSSGAFLTAFVAALVLANSTAWAQSQSLFGGRGTTSASTSNRAGSSTSSSGSMFGQSSFGSNSSGRSGSSGQSPGQTMLNGLGLQNNSMGLLNGQSLTQTGSSLVGNGFVGRADNPENFVGRRTTTATGTNRQGRNTRTNPRNARGQQGRNNANSADNSNAVAQRQQTVRLMARQRIAFEQSALPSSAVETKLNSRFDDGMKKRLDAKDLSFKLDTNGVLTMRGDVRTTEAKDLAEMIARMEPGVQDVRNDLSVTAPSPQ